MIAKIIVTGLLLARTAWAAEESWPAALGRMPLGPNPGILNHSNSAPLLLNGFQSNATVKALILLPGATDELYFFRRVHVTLTNEHPTLLDAIVALTNQSPLRATLRNRLLLIHSDEDVLDLMIEVKHARTVEKLKSRKPLAHVAFDDRDWDKLLDVIQRPVGVTLEPWRGTRGSWHFYRHSFAGWNLTPWETLQAAAYAGKTQIIVRRGVARFEVDSRFGALPKLESFPPKR